MGVALLLVRRTTRHKRAARLGTHPPLQFKPLEVSADGNTVLFTSIDRDESDLMIVDRFR